MDNDKKITEIEKRLKVIASNLTQYQRLTAIPGLSLITATALIASIGNATSFNNGRQLSAWY
ncbi:transposase [Candidatus Tisiphia endosymbiont of Dioctria rufipes]|uniref:transposase n=1 Tax=Candidatus Tisiphia endosymbiont of Dioctria rufipes TaxID=3066255 RepID=UPI00312CBE80